MSTFLYCLKQGVINICRNIWFSLASVATISACIFLFCLFFAMVANVQHGARAAEETVGISVFFDEGMDEEQIRSIGSQIQSWSEVREARYISAEEAWESFKSEYFEGMEELHLKRRHYRNGNRHPAHHKRSGAQQRYYYRLLPQSSQ